MCAYTCGFTCVCMQEREKGHHINVRGKTPRVTKYHSPGELTYLVRNYFISLFKPSQKHSNNASS